ncbi:MAG: hypothetical protein K0U36_04465 [Alphaproteobacteria bacterium]|nr:hypothetical protein [Alphaproteobacteria bacterium]
MSGQRETSILAPAKINLHLAMGKKEGTFHPLQSLVIFADFGDCLAYIPEDTPLHVSMAETDDKPSIVLPAYDNLIVRACLHVARALQAKARALQAKEGGQQILHRLTKGRIVATKRLPAGAGLGGGSSDAAAALRLLVPAWLPSLDRTELAYKVGADIPVCLTPSPQWVEGIGERTTPLPTFPANFSIIIGFDPTVHLATEHVFAAFDASKDNPTLATGATPQPADMGAQATQFRAAEWHAWLRTHARNHLTQAAIQVSPSVGVLLDQFRTHRHVFFSTLSGSGGACVGLCMPQHLAGTLTELRYQYPPATFIACNPYSVV